MIQVEQDLQPLSDQFVRFVSLHVDDESNAARVVFKVRIVEPLPGGESACPFAAGLHSIPQVLILSVAPFAAPCRLAQLKARIICRFFPPISSHHRLQEKFFE